MAIFASMLDPRQIYAAYEIIRCALTATDFTPDADTSRRNIPGLPEHRAAQGRYNGSYPYQRLRILKVGTELDIGKDTGMLREVF